MNYLFLKLKNIFSILLLVLTTINFACDNTITTYDGKTGKEKLNKKPITKNEEGNNESKIIETELECPPIKSELELITEESENYKESYEALNEENFKLIKFLSDPCTKKLNLLSTVFSTEELNDLHTKQPEKIQNLLKHPIKDLTALLKKIDKNILLNIDPKIIKIFVAPKTHERALILLKRLEELEDQKKIEYIKFTNSSTFSSIINMPEEKFLEFVRTPNSEKFLTVNFANFTLITYKLDLGCENTHIILNTLTPYQLNSMNPIVYGYWISLTKNVLIDFLTKLPPTIRLDPMATDFMTYIINNNYPIPEHLKESYDKFKNLEEHIRSGLLEEKAFFRLAPPTDDCSIY